MNKRAEKPVQKQTEQRRALSGKQQQTPLQLADDRSEAHSIQNHQQAADASPQSRQIAQFQKAADNQLNQQTPLPKKENKTGLPDSLKEGVEGLSGYSLNDVKVHYNSDKPAQLQAYAYAQGTDIHVASGQEKHLPHEAWHVVQQKQGRVKPNVQLKEAVPINDDAGLEKEADVMGAKAVQFKSTDQSGNQAISNEKKSGMNNQSGHPVQAVKFDRFLNFLYNNDEEERLLQKEKDVTTYFQEMTPYTPRFPEITGLGQELAVIRNKKVKAAEIIETSKDLQTIQQKLDRISNQITAVGMKVDDDMLNAYTGNSKGSKVGKIIQYYLDTIGFLPPYMNSEANKLIIKQTLHPDFKSEEAGYKDDKLGESDVELAQKRHIEMVRNIIELDSLLQKDWKDLKEKFGLKGGVKHVSFTGSDLHHGAEQVVIIESEGGQKVVYKPRSVAPDRALLDNEGSAFDTLNKKGAELPTMKFHASKTKGSYVEFIQHHSIKTVSEIKTYYYQLGQLAVASKLFGVNDLHYENIMAAANGPAIIDGETSFLMSVMTARDFESSELQKGVFEHISEIDLKLSNNSFYTVEERQAWRELGTEDPSFDKYIGNIRDKDVEKGGVYEGDLQRGIAHLLEILRVNKEEIGEGTTSTILRTDQVRIVPIGTNIFKICMRSYRDNKRNKNLRGIAGSVKSAEVDIVESLRGKGFEIRGAEVINGLVQQDFEAGDIPIIHYNGTSNELTWNGQVIGRQPDYGETKEKVDRNIEWILAQTVGEITESLQKV
ncbi:hypothetical protein D3C87_23580 [compost metagenome]